MLGNGKSGGSYAAGQNGSGRPSAAIVARLDATLTHVLASGDPSEGIQVFINARPIEPAALESLSVNVVAPTEKDPEGVLTAILSRYEGAGAARTQATTSLFPGTVEIVARGRRIAVSCREMGSFDGIWLGLGLRDDGTSTELTGVASLTVVVSPNLIDGRLVWADGSGEEDLLPE